MGAGRSQRRNMLSDEEVQLLDSSIPGWNAWRLKRIARLSGQK
jgi:hypothetical protein